MSDRAAHWSEWLALAIQMTMEEAIVARVDLRRARIRLRHRIEREFERRRARGRRVV